MEHGTFWCLLAVEWLLHRARASAMFPASSPTADERIAVIIPALNEESAIGRVIAALPPVCRVIVVDNGSTDRTPQIAAAAGAMVIHEPRRGYGAACLAGIAAAKDATIVAFIDGDFSDDPPELSNILAPLLRGEAELVIGSRTTGQRERGSLSPQQRFGNALTCFLVRTIWRHHFTDLGPFRAIRASALKRLRLSDLTYGWTIQMQIRAIRAGLRIVEVPVSYRRRIGQSKISGTLRGTFGAGCKILYTVAAEAISIPPSPPPTLDKLIVFARLPIPGHAKTRLIPALGEQGAADLQDAMTRRTLEQAGLLANQRPVSLEIRFTGTSSEPMRKHYGEEFNYAPQGEGDLGRRMSTAISDAFASGARRVVVIGTDCPDLTTADLAKAFNSLANHDLALGPARDGGYYLIGQRRHTPSLFQNIPWSTDEVLPQTMSIARDEGLTVHLLRTLSDVDLPDDLTIWHRTLKKDPAPVISVVIPAINEANTIIAAIASAKQSSQFEVLVVDGGSQDATADIAKAVGAIVLHSQPGRAAQMNAGARAARGQILIFLHADSRLPPHFDRLITSLLTQPHIAAGAFDLKLDAKGFRYRLIEFAVRLRSGLLQLPYGDQAIFCRSSSFFAAGAYPRVQILEDLLLIRRLRPFGKVARIPAPALSSARRWNDCGFVRTVLAHQAILLGHACGIPPRILVQWRRNLNNPRAENTYRAESAISPRGKNRVEAAMHTTNAPDAKGQ